MIRRRHPKRGKTRTDAPRHLFDCWGEISGQIRRAQHVALFADFDGTLTPIRRDPEAVRLAPRVRALLEQIANSGIMLGVVSGRKVADVRKHVKLKRIWYAGAHGMFLRDPKNHAYSLAKPEQKARMREATRLLAKHTRGAPGLRIEHKIVTVALHYRGASPKSQQIARDAVARAMERDPHLCLLSSKKVWGLLPDARSDKWAAISFILEKERRRNPDGRWLLIFIGDDATDERVFARMKGISIVVGKKRKTAARYWLRSPGEAREFLERLNATQR
ncbi:MAG: trehalose-phosphatase [Candidatus Acidiferrales bacterium]